ncbi:MAG: 50S ribosomal protein L5 [Patescibacteria group bacterium]|jgi:large subunit ribosomal protein L5
MDNYKAKYKKVVAPAMQAQFGYKNALAMPKIEKVVLNIGTGQGLKDAKFNDVVADTLQRITGQRPIRTRAKQSISNFKIREGLVVGVMVTLRGKKMEDFIDKLINITFPRIRDFRGISTKTVDQKGNLNIGFKEHISFPEIKSDEIEKIHGLQISVVTTAKTRPEGLELLKLVGFPFQKEE